MKNHHKFHIQVLGIGYSIDSALFAAMFGVSTVLSLVSDLLIEDMREFYCRVYGLGYKRITEEETDFRAKRITAYLNMLNLIVKKQFGELKNQTVKKGSDVMKYFELLPISCKLRGEFFRWFKANRKVKGLKLPKNIKSEMLAGSIDVNIMTKLDRDIYDSKKKKIEYGSDALAALRGFGNSDLHSSIVFSAGLNKPLFRYIKKFADFFPDENGRVQKEVIVKVSNYKSALVQGKFLAKLGILVSEFRIEGFNCGGHVFPTNGTLLGPILEEFKEKRGELSKLLYEMCNEALANEKDEVRNLYKERPYTRVSIQGGVSSSSEQKFLIKKYGVDSVGWGSAFLFVPEVVNVSCMTLDALIKAKRGDVFIADISPITRFHVLRTCESEINRGIKIGNNTYVGSYCPVDHLINYRNDKGDFVCPASRICQLEMIKKDPDNRRAILNKSCLCMELSIDAYTVKGMKQKGNFKSVICPGPVIKEFQEKYTLREMVDRIYGRDNSDHNVNADMFITELSLYSDLFSDMKEDYLKEKVEKEKAKKKEALKEFQTNVLAGIAYYMLLPFFSNSKKAIKKLKKKQKLENIF